MKRVAWIAAQGALWLAGVALLVALVAWPAVGIHAFWNVLIPAAPALLVLAPGLWRNICPLGTTALLARRLGLSSRRRLSVAWQERLSLLSVALLLAIVPLRHASLNADGPATAGVLLALALLAALMGLAFEWKSGWCSSLCPVHPVERLYGTRPALGLPNAHCASCEQCVTPCPDSSFALHPLSGSRTASRRVGGALLAGGFPGFVWGWFQVPDGAAIAPAYAWPLASMAASLALFLALREILPPERRPLLIRVFAAAAVAAYYWYRIPALVGLGPFPADGRLVDLSASLPDWFPAASRTVTTALLAAWFLAPGMPRRSWTVRPSFTV